MNLLWFVMALGVLVAAVTALVALVAIPVALLRSPAPAAPSAAAAAARRHAAVVSGIGWAVAVVTLVQAPGMVAGGLEGGIQLGLVPAAAGLLLAGVHAVGELTWPRPTGQVRRAALVRRTVADVAPQNLRRWAAGIALALAAVLVATGLTATDGRAVARTFVDGAASSGPYPGSIYGVPLLLGALAVLAANEGVLRLVARRPAVSDTEPAWDLALRRLSAHRILRGEQLVLGLTLAGVLGIAGTALVNVAQGYDEVRQASAGHQAAGVVLLVLAAATAVAVVVVALRPGTPATLDAPAPQPDGAPA